jgi:peptidoglycan/LPS O-acetylase OafA/YrhL
MPHLLGPHNYAASAQRIFLFATMFVGTVAYQAVRGRHSARTAIAIGALALANVGLCAWATGQGRVGPGLTLPYLRAWLGAYLVFGLALLARQRQFPSWLTGVGRLSYSIYLLNVLVIAALPRNANTGFSLLRWAILTLILSVASYHLIERPCIALGRRVLPHVGTGVTQPLSGRSDRVIAPTVSLLAALCTFLVVVEFGVYGVKPSWFSALLHVANH